MTRQQRAVDELHGALEALRAIGELVADGHESFEAEADHRAHLCYLWIVVGSRLKNHCAVLDISRATGEFAKAIAFRQKLAYEGHRNATTSWCGLRVCMMLPGSSRTSPRRCRPWNRRSLRRRVDAGQRIGARHT